MTAFSWLHFSDLHWGSRDHEDLWGQVENKLLKDIDDLQKKNNNLKWDVVFFTGDLVNKGEDKEFKALDKRLKRIWNHLNGKGPKPKLVVVPGNHDLVRPDEIDPALNTLTKDWNNAKIQHDLWKNHKNSDYWKLINNAFENYQKWWKRAKKKFNGIKIKAGYMPGDFRATHEMDGHKIGVVGLNTAFRQLAEGNYESELEFNAAQFKRLFGTDHHDWFDAHDVCFLLTHHPQSWLSASATKIFNGYGPATLFQIHLSGHLHDNEVSQIVSGDNPDSTRMIQSSSLFGCEEYLVYGKDGAQEEKKDRIHGFCAGTIRFGESGHKLIVWPQCIEMKVTHGYEFERHSCILQRGKDCIERDIPKKKIKATDSEHFESAKIKKLEIEDGEDSFKKNIKGRIFSLLSQESLELFRKFLIITILDQDKNSEIGNIIKKNKEGTDFSRELTDIILKYKLRHAISFLSIAVRDCFKTIDDSDWKKESWEKVVNILGWMVMLSVDKHWVERNKDNFKVGDQSLRIDIPVKTDAGVEIIVSAFRESAARLDYDHKEKRVRGKGCLNSLFPERGWKNKDRVLVIKQEIYRSINKKDPPEMFGVDEDLYLNEILETCTMEKEDHYLSIRTEEIDNPLNDRNVYDRLHEDLPALDVFYISMGTGDGALIVSEMRLKARLERFFKNKPKGQDEQHKIK